VYTFKFEDKDGNFVEVRGGTYESDMEEIYWLLMGFLVAKGWGVETVQSWLYELSAPKEVEDMDNE